MGSGFSYLFFPEECFSRTQISILLFVLSTTTSREGTPKVMANLKPSGELGDITVCWPLHSFQAPGKNAQSCQGIFTQRGGGES